MQTSQPYHSPKIAAPRLAGEFLLLSRSLANLVLSRRALSGPFAAPERRPRIAKGIGPQSTIFPRVRGRIATTTAFMSLIRRATPSPPSNRMCRSLQQTSHRPEREDRGLAAACPDRARAAPSSSLRAVPRILLVVDVQPRVRDQNAFRLFPYPARTT